MMRTLLVRRTNAKAKLWHMAYMEGSGTNNATSSMGFSVDRKETDALIDAIDKGTSLVHIAGGEGVKRQDIVHQTRQRLREDVITENVALPNGTPRDLIYEVANSLKEHQKTTRRLRETFNVGVGPQGPNLSLNGADQNFSRALDALRSALDGISEYTTVIIFIEDVTRFDDRAGDLEKTLQNIGAILPENVTVVTVGDSRYQVIYNIVVEPFELEQTSCYLRNEYPTISQEKVKYIHDAVNGYPLYLEVLSNKYGSIEELNNDAISLDVSQILEEYISGLPAEEREILRKISPLPEIDEIISSQILDLSQPKVADLLKKFERQSILWKVDRRGNRPVYRMRDDFQSIFYSRFESKVEVRSQAFSYYLEKALEEQDSDVNRLPDLLLAAHHLENLPGELDAITVKEVFEDKYPDTSQRIARELVVLLPQYSRFDWATEVLFLELSEEREKIQQTGESSLADLDAGVQQRCGVLALDILRGFLRILSAQKMENEEMSLRYYWEAHEILEGTTDAPDVIDELDIGMGADKFFSTTIGLGLYLASNNIKNQNSDTYLKNISEDLGTDEFSEEAIHGILQRTFNFIDAVNLLSTAEEVLQMLVQSSFEDIDHKDSVRGMLAKNLEKIGPITIVGLVMVRAELLKKELVLSPYLSDIWRILYEYNVRIDKVAILGLTERFTEIELESLEYYERYADGLLLFAELIHKIGLYSPTDYVKYHRTLQAEDSTQP